MVLHLTCQILHLRIFQSQKEYFPKTQLSKKENSVLKKFIHRFKHKRSSLNINIFINDQNKHRLHFTH